MSKKSVTAITGVARSWINDVAYKAQINNGIFRHVIPGARIMCTVTMKFSPVRMDENPKINAPVRAEITAVDVRAEYGVNVQPVSSWLVTNVKTKNSEPNTYI